MELLLDRLSKRYGAKAAVDNVRAALGPGMHALLGANGAGKTTLMRMLCGILEPDSGSVSLDGGDIFTLGPEYRNLLGYLPQDFGYYPGYTAGEFMLYIAALKGLPRSVAARRSAALLETVGLSKNAKQKIKTFSGGMKRRLGIAQALLNRPEILILDEPTAGLDPKERVRLRNLLSELANDRLVLLSTHIVSDVESAADRVLLMKAGGILLDGSPEALASQAEGKVWEVPVEEKRVPEWESRFNVANLRRESGRLYLRVISDESPCPEAIPSRPTLEDIYLYFFPTDKED